MIARKSPRRLADPAEVAARMLGAWLQHPHVEERMLRCGHCRLPFSPCQLRPGALCGHAADAERCDQLFAPCRCNYTAVGAEVARKLTADELSALREKHEARLKVWISEAPRVSLERVLAADPEPAPWPRPAPHSSALDQLRPLEPAQESFRVLAAALGTPAAARWLQFQALSLRCCAACRQVQIPGLCAVSLRSLGQILCLDHQAEQRRRQLRIRRSLDIAAARTAIAGGAA